MKGKYSYLSKNILLFTLSGFVPKILSFVLVPIYTSYLTTAEYGVSDLITATVQLLIPIFTLDIQDAVMRFSMDKNYQKDDVFSVAIRIITRGVIIICAAAFFVSFLNIKGITPAYLFFFAVMYITTALHNTTSLFCKGIDKVKVIVVSSIINSIITLGSNILFLVVFHWGLNGFLIANSIGALCALIYCFFGAKLFRYIKFSVPKKVTRDMVAFSFPLIFSVISWWINNASDRYILTWISGVAVSGVYAVAYKIPSLLSTFQGVFSQAWSISAIKEFDRNDTDGFIGKTYTMMNFAMSVICSVIMIGNIPAAKILYSNEFFKAWKFVPPLLISVVFNAMALFIGSIFTAVKDTKTLSVSTITGALVNIVLNFILIYYFGAYGAALATLIGYAVTLAMRQLILRKHIRMKIKLVRDLSVYALLIVQMVIAYWGLKLLPIQCVIFVIILLLYWTEIKNILQAFSSKIIKRTR